ncbi:DUF1648 domain-containing protein [Lactococcus piscium]|uniref:SdpI family protein n=1 Tax=Pseudolactococcus carnosus TaxID=2749961 RepID=UPI001FB8898D|nr:DUF1648 domain-containing protein [Lactococcus carnosus]MCJ1995834.1 DUF1648 domain-containing protein [Lactococcus carnosus]
MKIKQMTWPILLGLLPIVIGLVLYRQLPDQLPIHWGLNGQANTYMGKLLVILLMPGVMLALNVVLHVAFVLNLGKSSNPKIEKLLMWVLPIMAIVIQSLSFSEALGYHLSISLFVMCIIGILFMVLGNYIPKTTINRAVGFRLPSTLNNPDNWQKTNRLGGIMLVMSGLLSIIGGVISLWYPIIIFPVLIFMMVTVVLIPLIYSVRLSRNK